VRHLSAVRPARPDEAEALTALAMRSKAHWGYDAAFMELAASDLRIQPEAIEGAAAFVAENGATMVGFYILADVDGMPTLRDLWVDPPAIGTGVGARLWTHMLVQAQRLGYSTVRVTSEPNAEGFYVKMGARRIGSVESSVEKGRMLPLMEVAVAAFRDAAKPVPR
jgi:predicted N-acetyltransferase YhbS